MPSPETPNRPIVFVDSGVGGLPYVEQMRRYLLAAPVVYVADTASFPYGNKQPAQVVAALSALVERIIARFRPALIVLACNTASVLALAELRTRFDIPFVGVVPAIKPAALSSVNGRIGILATSRTVGAAYLDSLVSDFASDCIVERIAGSELVQFVEDRLMSSSADERVAVVRPVTTRFASSGIDTLVLGCTHFIYLADEIRAELGNAVRVIDSRDGVARRIAGLAHEPPATLCDGLCVDPRDGLCVDPRDGLCVDPRDGPGDGEVETTGATERVGSGRHDRLFTTGISEKYDRFADMFLFQYCGVL